MAPKRKMETITLSDSDDETPARPKAKVPKRTDDTFEDDMRAAMALSLAGSSASGSGTSTMRSTSQDAAQSGSIGVVGGRPLAGSSRVDMERERLARQQAHEASSTTARPKYMLGQPAARPKVVTLSDLTDGASSSASTSAVASSSSSSIHGFSSTSSAAGPPPSARFWAGSIKRVSNRYVPDSDSFTFAQVLGPTDKLEMAIVSSYVLDVDWVLTHFPEDVPLVLVKPQSSSKGKGKGQPEVLTGAGRTKTFKVSPVEHDQPGGWSGAMHSKAIILAFKDFCRVVIPSANMIDFDWERNDNVLFIQDFPRLASADKGRPDDNPSHTTFSRDLLGALRKLSVPIKFLTLFRDFNFSKADEVKLIWSNQGSRHYDWDDMDAAGGIVSIANGVKALNFSKGGHWEIEATGSSIGKYSDSWLSNFLSACSGIHPKEYFTSKTRVHPELRSGKNLPIKIVFPTLAEIDASRGGRPGAGTLFFPEKHWKDNKFPKHLLYRGQSKRQGVVAHTKTIIALHRPGNNPPADYKPEGWIYIGSHNFTAAAWGTLQYSPNNGPGILIPNYELGVIIPIRGDSMEDVERQATALASFRRPLVKYSTTDVPWQQDVYK